jgi:hypothetical protein
LSNVEVWRDSQPAAEVAEFQLIQRFPLKTRSNLLYGVMVFAKALIQAASVSQSFLGVGRHRHTQATGQSGLPPHQIPFAVPVSVFSGLNKGGRDADLRRHQVLPLVPGWIPPERKKRRIDMYFRFATAIPVDCTPVEIFHTA